MQRDRPYSGTNKINNQHFTPELIIHIEDVVVAKLAQKGCVIRPKGGRFEADLHHRVDLNFDADKKLTVWKNVPRKGPRMKDWAGTNILQQIDNCIIKACEELVGVAFESAKPNMRISLYLPLIPTDK